MSSKKYNKSLELTLLAKNLIKIKKSRQFGNYKKMALLLKISDQHMSDIVRQKRIPSDRLIDSMAMAFNIPREKLLSGEDFPITADKYEGWTVDPKRRQLIEKVKRLVQVADDGTVNALLHNVDTFQKGAEAMREVERLQKTKRKPPKKKDADDDEQKSKSSDDPTDPLKWELEPGPEG